MGHCATSRGSEMEEYFLNQFVQWRCLGFNSRQLLAFYFPLFSPQHLNSFISSVTQDALLSQLSQKVKFSRCPGSLSSCYTSAGLSI